MTNGSKAGAIRAYVGSYTTAERKARGDGIHAYSVDLKTGQWTHIDHLGGLTNPSMLRANRAGTRLYSVHGDLDYVTAYAVDPATGRTTELGRAASGGVNGVSLALDPSERHLAVANYRSSNVALLPIAEDGSLRDASQIFKLSGTLNSLRRVGHQEGPHPHDVMFDPSGRYLLAVDKGLDGVTVLRFDGEKLHAHGFVAARGGAGPRHITFDSTGQWAWVCNELESSVTAYRWAADDGSLIPTDIAFTLPADFVDENTTAELAFHAGSRTLYVSNRGHDSIAIFRFDPKDGSLKPLGFQASGGKCPRFCAVDPTNRFLYVANENSDTVVSFAIDLNDGRLTQIGTPVPNGSPVTIAFTVAP
jgi:6-phosphogluconolactonase (cycloisomerase 2 family)